MKGRRHQSPKVKLVTETTSTFGQTSQSPHTAWEMFADPNPNANLHHLTITASATVQNFRFNNH